EALALFIVTKGTERLLFGEYQRQATLSKGTSFRKAAVTGGDGRYLTEVDFNVAITDTAARVLWLSKTLAGEKFTSAPLIAPGELAVLEVRVEIARLNSDVWNYRNEYVQLAQKAFKLKEELARVERELVVASAAARTVGSDSENLRIKIAEKRTRLLEAKRAADNEASQAEDRLSSAIRRRIDRRAKLHELETLQRRAAHAAEEQQLSVPPAVAATAMNQQSVTPGQAASTALAGDPSELADELVRLRGKLAALRTEYSELTQLNVGHQMARGLKVDVSDPGLRQVAPAALICLGEMGEPARVMAGKRWKALYEGMLAQGSPDVDAERCASQLYALSIGFSAARRPDVVGPAVLVHRILAPLYQAPPPGLPVARSLVGNAWIYEITMSISMIGLPGTTPDGIQAAWKCLDEALELINAGYLLPDASVFRLRVDDSSPSPEFVFTVGDVAGWSLGQHVGSSTSKEDVAKQLLGLLGVTVQPGQRFALGPAHCEQLAQTVLMAPKSVSPVMLSGIQQRTERRPEFIYVQNPADAQAKGQRQADLDDLTSELARQIKRLTVLGRAVPEVRIAVAEEDRPDMQRMLEENVRDKLAGFAIAQPITFAATDTEMEPLAGQALFYVEWDPEGAPTPEVRIPVQRIVDGDEPAGDLVRTSDAQVVPDLIGSELDNEQVWRYSELTADSDGAAWTKLESPLRPWHWEESRMWAHVATVDQMSYIPIVRAQMAPGKQVVPKAIKSYVAYDLRRMCVNGQWVQEYTIRLHLSGGTPDQQDMLARRARRGLDALFNHRYRLPGGDQLHVRIEFVGAAADAHATITVADAGNANQFRWSLSSTQRILAHEVGHFLGIRDHYRSVNSPTVVGAGMDRDPVVRKHQVIRPSEPGKARARETASLHNAVRDDHGLYAELRTEPGVVVAPRDIWRIEYVSRGYAVVRDYVEPDEDSDSGSDSAPSPDRLSSRELEGLVDSMLQVAVYRDGGAGVWLPDPASDVTTLEMQESVVQGLPVDTVLFSVISHVGASGMPEFLGQEVTPQVMAALLKRMRRDGVWDGHKMLRFVSCGLAAQVSNDYVPDVLRLVQFETGATPAALAPNTLVWGTPNLSGQGSSHDLVVASNLGYDGNGRPIVSSDGRWVVFDWDVSTGEVTRAGEYDAHLTVAGNGDLRFDPAPGGYGVVDTELAKSAIEELNSDSMPFGESDDLTLPRSGEVDPDARFSTEAVYEALVSAVEQPTPETDVSTGPLSVKRRARPLGDAGVPENAAEPIARQRVEFDARSTALTQAMEGRLRELIDTVVERSPLDWTLTIKIVGSHGNNPSTSVAEGRGRERLSVVENRINALLEEFSVRDLVTVVTSMTEGSLHRILDRRDSPLFKKRRKMDSTAPEQDGLDSVVVVVLGNNTASATGDDAQVEASSTGDFGSIEDVVDDLDGAVVGDGDLFGLLRPSGVPGFLVGHDFS
ncbi:hypothetical protein ABTX61_40500, partial [Amycolatopsis japonica]|uniref:hypothetical protein n=1 Tax=Amycolatopsis japonica TaxID=208439 RepID=UPI00332D8508